jgi:hypothetical protein
VLAGAELRAPDPIIGTQTTAQMVMMMISSSIWAVVRLIRGSSTLVK